MNGWRERAFYLRMYVGDIMEAFKPRKVVFMHICANCEYGRKVTGSGGSALGYICSLKKNTQRLFGTHECDELAPEDKDQVNCFEDLKPAKGDVTEP